MPLIYAAPSGSLAAAVDLAQSRLPGSASAQHCRSFAHEGILGTSLDLIFVVPDERTALAAEHAALEEIERVRRIISSWDDTSELSRLWAAGASDHPSAELVDVLEQYVDWSRRTDGAYEALPMNRVVGQSAWRIEPSTRRVTALTELRPDTSSLGKGYVIDRAVAAARAAVPSVRGGLINIGGDVQVWGESPAGPDEPWRIGVADPRRFAENARPLTVLSLTAGAISSSGGYERAISIGGERYSHIVDARTGRPATGVLGATVVARNSAAANALATSLSVLLPNEGLRLVETEPGSAAIVTLPSDVVVRSPRIVAYEDATYVPANERTAPAIASLTVDFAPRSWNRHRPYVAVWVTDTAGKHIRTLAQWGNRPKYMRELSEWWSTVHPDQAMYDAVTRATRYAGKYTLEWDGLDQKGAPVPQGPYTFWVEAAYEHGAHSVKRTTLTCGDTSASGTIEPADAFGGGTVQCTMKR